MVELEDIHWFKDKIFELKYSKKKLMKKRVIIKNYHNQVDLIYLLKKKQDKLERINQEIKIYNNTMKQLQKLYSLKS